MISKNYLEIHNNNLDIKIKPSETNTEDITFYNKNSHDLINKYKCYIESINQNWDNIKKLSNDYELISNPNDSVNSIAKYRPLSRSYYKLWEIAHDFDIIPKTNKINYAGLAEAPGGFVECVYRYRKNLFLGINDNKYCITLNNGSDSQIPNFRKLNRLINETIILPISG